MNRRPSLWLILGVLVSLGGCGGAVDAEPSGPTSTQAATESGPSPSEDVAATLDRIVIAEAEPPTATKYLQSFDGSFSGTQTVQDSPESVRAAVLQGWVTALTREFASRAAAEVIRGNAPPSELDPADHHFVGSIASAYMNPTQAQAAFAAIVTELRSRAQNAQQLELGDGGTLFRGRLLGVLSVTYVWTNERFLLVMTANGMDDEESDALAVSMDERASQP